jgi:hypothetical protein
MPITMRLLKITFATLVISLLAATAVAQGRKLVEEDWYGDVKKILADHYTGKSVRLKLPIPATRRGLEMIDGNVQREASRQAPQFSAQIGDELLIKSFKVGDSSVEVLLGKDEPERKSLLPNPFAGWKQPRINLKFSHELSSKDMTIENLNRYLAIVVDVSTLAQANIQNDSTQAQTPAEPQAQPPAEPEAPRNSEPKREEQAVPTSGVIANLPSAGPDIGELTVECSTKGSRVYIDGAYSGPAPRTVRLRSGVYTILLVSDGYASWEQRLFIPGGKISIVRVELQKR